MKYVLTVICLGLDSKLDWCLTHFGSSLLVFAHPLPLCIIAATVSLHFDLPEAKSPQIALENLRLHISAYTWVYEALQVSLCLKQLAYTELT